MCFCRRKPFQIVKKLSLINEVLHFDVIFTLSKIIKSHFVRLQHCYVNIVLHSTTVSPASLILIRTRPLWWSGAKRHWSVMEWVIFLAPYTILTFAYFCRPRWLNRPIVVHLRWLQVRPRPRSMVSLSRYLYFSISPHLTLSLSTSLYLSISLTLVLCNISSLDPSPRVAAINKLSG